LAIACFTNGRHTYVLQAKFVYELFLRRVVFFAITVALVFFIPQWLSVDILACTVITIVFAFTLIAQVVIIIARSLLLIQTLILFV
jgi:hypothetical protein